MGFEDLKIDIYVAKEMRKLIRKQMNAIDAVMELHSIKEWGPMEEWGKKEPFSIYICNKCKFPYPCETIQAIEKELK